MGITKDTKNVNDCVTDELNVIQRFKKVVHGSCEQNIEPVLVVLQLSNEIYFLNVEASNTKTTKSKQSKDDF